MTDSDLIGTKIMLDPITLTDAVTHLPGGLAQIEIDAGIDYMLRIFQAPGDWGALLMTAVYELNRPSSLPSVLLELFLVRSKMALVISS